MTGPSTGADAAVDGLLKRAHFPPAGAPIDCAVSGGADSLALLYLATAAGCAATAHHVDHGLREGSADEAEVVREAAKRWGAEFVAHTVDVAGGPGLEARARAARYAVLPDAVVTGHTLDDRVETMLINLLRGATRSGLAVVTPSRRHPIAALRRHETTSLCDALDVRPIDDPSNRDPVHLRTRVRHEVLPLLDSIVERDVAAVIARQGDLLADEDRLLDELASRLDPTDAKQIAAAHPSLARRAMRRWIAAETAAEHPLGSAAIERALAVARGDAVAHDLAKGHRIHRSEQRLRIETSSVPGQPAVAAVQASRDRAARCRARCYRDRDRHPHWRWRCSGAFAWGVRRRDRE